MPASFPTVLTDAVAGPFRAYYAGPGGAAATAALTGGTNPSPAHLGVIGERGVRQIRKFEGEDITSDILGSSVIDSVYLGGQMFLEFELQEANLQNVLALTNPFARAMGDVTVDKSNEVGIPGTFMASAHAGSLALIPLYSTTGTIHTTAGGQTTPVRLYQYVTLAAGFESEINLNSKRKLIPVRLRVFPFSDGGSPAKYLWYSVAAVSGTYLVD